MGPVLMRLVVYWYFCLLNVQGSISSPDCKISYHPEIRSKGECETFCFNRNDCQTQVWKDEKCQLCIKSGVTCSKSNHDCLSSSEDNVIIKFPNIQDEKDCQALCGNHDIAPNCSAYTWQNNILKDKENKCYLLSHCVHGGQTCPHCHSGPKECHCKKPTDPHDGHWNCNFSPDLVQGWPEQYTDCYLKCSSTGIISGHIDCNDHEWDPPVDNFICKPEPPITEESCGGERIPSVPHGEWECFDDDEQMCRRHCILTCNPGYIAPDKDTLECDWNYQPAGCKWCGFDKDTSGQIGIECQCNGCDWYQPARNDFSCIKSGSCDTTFPDGSSYSSSSWSCMLDGNPIVPPETLVERTECRRRCEEGQNSQGYYICEEANWRGQASSCVIFY